MTEESLPGIEEENGCHCSQFPLPPQESLLLSKSRSLDIYGDFIIFSSWVEFDDIPNNPSIKYEN